MNIISRIIRKINKIRESNAASDIMALISYTKDYYYPAMLDQMRRMAERAGCKDLTSYYRLLRSDREKLEQLKTNLTFKGTHFFRGPYWDVLSEKVLKSYSDKETVRIWCAGCSSGEEVFSLMMAAVEYIPLDKLDILATDYDEDVLNKFRTGTYFNLHYKEIPEKYLPYVITGEKKFTFGEEMRKSPRIENLNLLTDEYPTGFDLIVCRNVIKFFSAAKIREIEGRFCDCLIPGGYLFLSEDVNEDIHDPHELGFERLGESTIYRRIK